MQRTSGQLVSRSTVTRYVDPFSWKKTLQTYWNRNSGTGGSYGRRLACNGVMTRQVGHLACLSSMSQRSPGQKTDVTAWFHISDDPWCAELRVSSTLPRSFSGITVLPL